MLKIYLLQTNINFTFRDSNMINIYIPKTTELKLAEFLDWLDNEMWHNPKYACLDCLLETNEDCTYITNVDDALGMEITTKLNSIL